jgi:muramoyltetrapeptide carboxypeptidase
LLEQIITQQDRLVGLPVLANVDFGHTDPRITFPIGGRAALAVGTSNALHIADS